MQASEASNLTAQVLWAVFLLALLYGAIAERSHFCTMGAVADVVNFGDWRRLHMWALAAGVVTIGFNLMVAAGWVSADKTLYGGSRWQWASALVGGALFGFGMVLASGCGSKNLVRLGGGNLKALVVLLVMGLSAWMTLRGLTAMWRVETVDRWAVSLPGSQDLPSLIAAGYGGSTPDVALVVGTVVGTALLAWALWARPGRDAGLLLGGIGIGAVVLAVWWVSGRFGHLAEHPETLEEAFLGTASRRMEALSFVTPVAQGLEWLIFYSDQGRRLSTGVVAVCGLVAGSWLVNIRQKSFRWEGFGDSADTARHLIGATMMGIGGVTAMGCTIGQGLSGLSTLGLTSLVAVAAIIAGAVAGLRFLNWQLERAA
ncbi:protein of unknown function DUF395 YeeE/YedE [Leptothrix cholodnii SP-6]|uniref:Uncharacterized protein n=1 Tax=Leptothrix cholodnii (strain ATCC 51168 / LMG 8142 / SP-6) TaxID=395495 RepID=B1Y0V0_LEPCP|nr:YeeE/YedE family protein [Leptothrix cholodnii]ACB34208.1 protein of unknown function DUF395 YeeE/YedE [Leptothrix cholodnii SP-6]